MPSSTPSTAPSTVPSGRRWPGRLLLGVAITILLLPLAPVLFMQFVLSDAMQTRPGTGGELAALKRESIGHFVPDGATVHRSWASPGHKALFGGPESETTLGRSFDVDGDIGSAMRAFVEPATADGWSLVSVSCSRVRGRSTIGFAKRSGPYSLELTVEQDPISGTLAATLAVPIGGGRPVPDTTVAVTSLLDTGVSRTDPGCLATRRVDALAPTPTPWNGPVTCRVLSAAWPGAVVDPEGQYCWVQVAGTALSVEAVGTTDPYAYQDDRLSPAGDDHLFALVDGGFWVARPDGVAVVARSNGGVGLSGPPSEEVLLALAAQVQAAPGP